MSRSERENRERFQDLLRELFQFDAADLDFGIYRVMNQRRDTIERFIEEDLLAAVDESLETLADAEREEIEDELDRVTEELNEEWDEDIFAADGSLKEQYSDLNHNDLVAYRDLREQRETVAVTEETESRVFSDLYRFFARYYEDGDFHTKRRISGTDAKYAVPYNGEETHFHWANRDQYYVKSGEHFVDYRFDAENLSVEFRLEAADVPHDDVKGDDRYFVLGGDSITFDAADADEGDGGDEEDAEDGTCTITFQYRKITEAEAEEFVADYNAAEDDDRSSFAHMTVGMRCAALEERILNHVENPAVETALTAPADTDSDDPPTHLAKNLRRYVSENSMDYFVHKDLESFLEGELEYFLQNEVLDVDDLLSGGASESQAVLRARTVRSIAERVITFLAQIEAFQKRLFEKKKFVVQTDYMVTVDQVPDGLYDRVLDNEAQLEQWREVYNTDEWDTSLAWDGTFDQRFLQNHPHVMVDTGLFEASFKRDLLAAFADIEAATDGVLVNSENFQALNLLSEKFSDKVTCSYIDPPYNTGNDGFLYKDKYQHSTWLSMMNDRLKRIHEILPEDGSIFISNDDSENDRLNLLLNDVFGKKNSVAEVIWEKVYSPKNSAKYFSEDHDYITVYAKNKQSWRPNLLPRSDNQDSRYENPDDDPRGKWKPSDLTARNPYSEGQYEVESPSGDTFSAPTGRYWSISKEKFEELDEDNRISWGVDGDNMPHLKRFLSEVQDGMVPQTLWGYDEVGHTQRAKKELLSFVDFEDTANVLNSVKPTSLLKRVLRIGTDDDATEWVMDFFAGSGPTAHAAIDLNREEDSDRRYVLVEMGEYFDTMIRPRLQRTVLSSGWSEGVPTEQDGVTHLVKYHRLESYEDALNNITLREQGGGGEQQELTERIDDYVEGYLLDFESRESAPLLPEGTFAEPFDHELQIEQGGTSREGTPVDLVETFHYLLGADVRQYHHDTHQDRPYVVTECEVETDSGVETVLTAWRRRAGLDLDREADWFEETFESASFDRVYVNGESQITRAEPLEITFRERMEAGPNVA